MPRILITDDGVGLWGAQKYVFRLAPFLEAAGYEIVVAAPLGSAMKTAWEDRGGQTVPLPPLRGFRMAMWGTPAGRAVEVAGYVARLLWRATTLALVVRREHIDLIIGNSFFTHPDAALAGRLARVPSVLHLHETQPSLRLRNLAVRLATQSLAVSEAVAAQLSTAARERTTVVRNGVDTDWFSPGAPSADVRRRLAADPTAPIVAYLGRIDPAKQIGDMIRAVAEVKGGERWAQFVIMGDTSQPDDRYVKEVTAQAAELLGERARIFGSRGDVREVLRSVDVLVLAGRWEGLSLGLLEALSSGCPVVAYDAAGVGEVIVDGETGFVAEMDNWSELGARIQQVVEDDQLRARMKAAGPVIVRQRHSLATQAASNVGLLGDVGRHHRRSGRLTGRARVSRCGG